MQQQPRPEKFRTEKKLASLFWETWTQQDMHTVNQQHAKLGWLLLSLITRQTLVWQQGVLWCARAELSTAWSWQLEQGVAWCRCCTHHLASASGQQCTCRLPTALWCRVCPILTCWERCWVASCIPIMLYHPRYIYAVPSRKRETRKQANLVWCYSITRIPLVWFSVTSIAHHNKDGAAN